MSWIEAAALAGIALGLAGCIVLFFLRPQYWIDAGLYLLVKLAPIVVKWLLNAMKRMTPEEEAELVKATARGERDEWLKARQRRKMRERREMTDG